ncbi:MAG: helix-turn-helix transcriptional regulator [Eubacterium sp.]|nr:helix-turn-helix transcriptional regulator [Eubacterium sp.]
MEKNKLDEIKIEESQFLYHVGLSIKKYRCIAGLSQEQLSDVIECDKNTIGNIERGERDPRLSTLARIADGLGISCSRILRETENTSSDTLAASIEYDYLRLFQYCRQLTPEQFNNLCNTAHLYAESNKLNSQS